MSAICVLVLALHPVARRPAALLSLKFYLPKVVEFADGKFVQWLGRRLKHSGSYDDKRLTKSMGKFAFANRVIPCQRRVTLFPSLWKFEQAAQDIRKRFLLQA